MDTLPHCMRSVKVLDVEQHFGNHVSDCRHFLLLHAAGGDSGCAEANTAALKRRTCLEWDGVFIHRNTRFIERDLV